MPARKISLKDFKTLIRRRNRTLSRLTTTTSNPDLKPHFDDLGKNGSKDGNFIEIGEMGYEKIGKIDGKFEEIGKNGTGCQLHFIYRSVMKNKGSRDNIFFCNCCHDVDNMATLPSRTNSGVGNSPSRFALAGQQGLPPTFPSVSVSQEQSHTSSPSPCCH
ncbi:hypothetical protein Leryth_022460 [Lithospermum erythrorhizon]|nr:hypothetical protein Leryth_022460 [Lithospermum erythrorhizon]